MKAKSHCHWVRVKPFNLIKKTTSVQHLHSYEKDTDSKDTDSKRNSPYHRAVGRISRQPDHSHFPLASRAQRILERPYFVQGSYTFLWTNFFQTFFLFFYFPDFNFFLILTVRFFMAREEITVLTMMQTQ